MSRRVAAVEGLQDRLGYRFKDAALLERALTHASLVGKSKTVADSNERLEFLGDRVLGLVIAEELARRDADATPKLLTRRFHLLIDKTACARVGRELGIPEALNVDAGVGLRRNETVVADCCEALIAAVYMDAGFEACAEVVRAAWSEELDRPMEVDPVHPKMALQEWALARTGKLPRYQIVSREGPPHASTFEVEVTVEGVEPQRGAGSSIKEAEKAAAQALLQREPK